MRRAGGVEIALVDGEADARDAGLGISRAESNSWLIGAAA
jgi:hypothetical protein